MMRDHDGASPDAHTWQPERPPQVEEPNATYFPRCGYLLVGRALGLRLAPRPAPLQFRKIRRALLGAARRRGVCPNKSKWHWSGTCPTRARLIRLEALGDFLF